MSWLSSGMSWLNGLPSGAWALIGAVVASAISFVGVLWQNHAQAAREDRARRVFVADRTRDERRIAYAAILLSSRKAAAAINRHFNEQQFNFDPSDYPGIENYDHVWEMITGDFSESATLARLVASDAVRAQIDVVAQHFTDCVFAIVEPDDKPPPSQRPVKVLEDLLAFELEYRDAPEGVETPEVEAAAEDDSRSTAEESSA
jgi:hypothetical protein